MLRFTLITAAICLALAACRPAAAQETIVLDVASGAVFDAVIDGFPMLAAYDGVPDFPTGYNTLSIAFQLAVTEERGIGEFPTAPLAGVAADAVAHATLTFNIDDVITSFGPGTGFSGAAARDILVHLYAGNGTVEIDDYLAVARAPHVIDTRPLGRITDETVAHSGPLRFEVDVSDDVRALLDEGAAAIGVVWRTADSPTGTSLDHLGEESAGPPGVNGAFLPFLTIALSAAPTPTPTVTATAPEPLPTATAVAATPTATRGVAQTPTGPAACAGDCDADGAVSIAELIAGVALALGGTAEPCAAMDWDGDGTVGVTDLVRAVASALAGC